MQAIGVFGLLFACAVCCRAATCRVEPLLHQRRDAATVQRLEEAWSVAYLRGDTEMEQCLLTPDFTEVMRSGEIKTLKYELDLAEANQGKGLKVPDLPKSTVMLHGNVAVAYGVSSSKTADGRVRSMRYVDYYVWEGGVWRAFFAQQTEIQTASS